MAPALALPLGTSLGRWPREFVHFLLHEVPAPQRTQAVRHLARVLRPGGTIVLREPIAAAHGIAPQEIRRLMTEAGLQEVRLKTGKVLLIQSVCDGTFQKPTTYPPDS
jgi:hypothetical protein